MVDGGEVGLVVVGGVDVGVEVGGAEVVGDDVGVVIGGGVDVGVRVGVGELVGAELVGVDVGGGVAVDVLTTSCVSVVGDVCPP